MLRNTLVTLIQKQITKAWHEGNLDPAAITEDIINKAIQPLLDEEGVALITDDPGAESNGRIRVSGTMSATKIKDDEWVLFHNGMTSFVTNDYVVGWENAGSMPNSPAAKAVEFTASEGYLPDPPKYLYNSTEPTYDQAVYDVGGDPLSGTPYADTEIIELDSVLPATARYYKHMYTQVKWRLRGDVLERQWNGSWQPVDVDDIEDFLNDDNIKEVEND